MSVKEAEQYDLRLQSLQRHIRHVQESCWVLAERILKRGNPGDLRFAHTLVTHAQIHDHSKFSGIEWEYLWDNVKDKSPELYDAAYLQHVTTNEHHPECWGDITKVPDIFLAEMVCDWHARATEFGTDLRTWIKEKATKRYDFPATGKVYKKIKEYVDLLLDKPFG